jgi:hypothetical protein
MARPNKQGLDYFPLDIDFLSDLKVRKVKKVCGPQSIAVLIHVLCTIYRNGYYVRWTEDSSFFVAEDCGLQEEEVARTLERCFEVGFLSRDMFKLHGVLTSRGIQQRFLRICQASRRQCTIQEYNLLVSSAETHVSSAITPVSSEFTPQKPDSCVNPSAETPISADLTSSVAENAKNGAFPQGVSSAETTPSVGVSSAITPISSELTPQKSPVSSELTPPIKEKEIIYPPRNSPLPDDRRRRGDFSFSSFEVGKKGLVSSLADELLARGVSEDDVFELARLCNNFEVGHIGTEAVKRWLAQPQANPIYVLIQACQRLEDKNSIQVSMSREASTVYRFLKSTLKPSDYALAVSLIQRDDVAFSECKGLVKDCKRGKITNPEAFIMGRLKSVNQLSNQPINV